MALFPLEFLTWLFPGLSQGSIRQAVQASSGSEQDLISSLIIMNADREDEHWIAALAAEAGDSKLLVLLRGLPGSGKSTLARAISAAASPSCSPMVASADDFFVDKDGRYTFVPNLIGNAHEWCQKKVKVAHEWHDIDCWGENHS